jgi:thymidylate synthase (FAD)
MGHDESIVAAARQSTSGSFVSWESYEGHPKGDAGLLDFLYREHHSTPFEMAALIVEVQAPLMVVREWQRHRTFSYNELSGRYTVMPDLHYLPDPSRMQKQSTANKQGSAEALSPQTALYLQDQFKTEQQRIYLNYGLAMDYGLAREVARLNTPLSRYTRMRVSGNLRNWLHFLQLRLAPNAQWEIRQFAEAVAKIVEYLWPRTWALFEEYDRFGKRYSRTEIAKHVALAVERDTLRKAVEKLLSRMPPEHMRDLFEKDAVEFARMALGEKQSA